MFQQGVNSDGSKHLRYHVAGGPEGEALLKGLQDRILVHQQVDEPDHGSGGKLGEMVVDALENGTHRIRP